MIPTDKILGQPGHIQDHHDIDATLTSHQATLDAAATAEAAQATLVASHTTSIATLTSSMTAANAAIALLQQRASNTRIEIQYDAIAGWPRRIDLAGPLDEVDYYGPLGNFPIDAQIGDEFHEAQS